MGIFNIIESHYKLMIELEENGGELTDGIIDQLEINEKEVEKHIKSFYGIKKTLESEIQIIKDEKERLSNLQKVKENNIERVKKIVAEILKVFGKIGKSI